MANKRLTAAEIQQMKTMVVNGNAPEDIAKHFGIAISSVHNYKNKFKADGVKFPSVKGKRPVGSIDVPGSFVKSTKQLEPVNGNLVKDGMKFIVNGVSVQISGQAKNVSIGKDSMEINF